MAQTSGCVPALSDNVKKGPKRPKRVASSQQERHTVGAQLLKFSQFGETPLRASVMRRAAELLMVSA